MFTDVVDSTRLGEALGDDAWRSVLRWHDQTIRAAVAEHGGEEIKATGDGFFIAFGDTDEALAAAIAIQRRFDAQRRNQGFAPAIRVGIHRADASRKGLDYVGGGVNTAARIGGAAVGGKILVSASTLENTLGRHIETDRRAVVLKGISDPVEVVSVDPK
jgi:class 3 adenylate cyclase